MELGSQLEPHSLQISPSIHIRSRELEIILHPHFAPQRIPMGNHKTKYYHPLINITSPIMSKAAIVETQRQPAGIVITQSL
jgi:hypothetical protein